MLYGCDGEEQVGVGEDDDAEAQFVPLDHETVIVEAGYVRHALGL